MNLKNAYLFLLLLITQNIYADVLFQEDFDSLADWMTAGPNNVGSLPGAFDYGYTGEFWHPTETSDSLASIYISGNNTNQVYGGTGKALITTFESHSSTGIYTSDGFITKDIPPSNEVYVSFKMKFQPGFNIEEVNGSIKLFRILSYDGTGSRADFFSDGNTAPMYLFDWSRSDYGVRQKHSFRCDDQATTYFCSNPTITNAPQSINSGDMSANFTSHIASLSPELTDLVNGGILPTSGNVWHNQVYGDVWHSLEYYVKLNSSPSVNDGELKFWFDGELIIDMNEIPWIGNNGSMDAKWNGVAFGGNGKYHWNTSDTDPVTAKERWVAIDDILILDGLPFKPTPPTEVSVD